MGPTGQTAAVTNYKLIPSNIIAVYATYIVKYSFGQIANIKWQHIIINAPKINIDAPFPLLSKKLPRIGVSNIAPIGKYEKISLASVLEIPKRHSNIFDANFWNGNMAE